MSLCINLSCGQPQNSDSVLFCASCGSQLLLEGQYRVVKVLSKKGGFANTYEVLQQQQAKVLKMLKSDDAKAIELFEREFQVLSGISYPGIPRVDDLFLYQPRNSGQPLHCIVMEKIEGIDLEEYLVGMGQPIDQKVAINWLAQLTQTLQALHSKGIFHRDIKPSNIILQPDGQLGLIDFGAVKQSLISQGQTRIFTPGYAAPEQEQGEAAAPSDFFSLGRTMVHLLTDKNPTELYDIQKDEFLWRNKSTNVSLELMDLLDQMMDSEPQKRPTPAQILKTIADLKATHVPKIAKTLVPDNQSNPVVIVTDPVPKTTASWVYYLLGLIPLLGLGLIGGYFWQNGGLGNSTARGQYFSAVTNIPTGQFRFGGSTSWATTRQSQSSLDSSIQGAFPQFKLVYTDPDPAKVPSVAAGQCSKKPGSNTGICMLIKGELEFTQSSISLAKSRYADRVTEYRLQEIPVAYDAVTVVVNHQLKIPGLTMAQLRDIYMGTVTNWNQVGGPNLPIVPFSRDPNAGGTVSSFQDLVLGKEGQFNFDMVKIVKTPNDGLQKVKSNPSAIYYGSAKEMIVDFCDSKPLLIGSDQSNLVAPFREPLQTPNDCRQGKKNQINTDSIKTQQYPLTRKIYVIFKADGLNSQKAGESYAHLLKTQQGQDLLEKAGFVGIGH
jgi:serine/threonine protein kinase